jgi:hypothetical protein
MNSRRVFTEIAAALREVRPYGMGQIRQQWNDDVRAIAYALQSMNRAFDWLRFLDDCGMNVVEVRYKPGESAHTGTKENLVIIDEPCKYRTCQSCARSLRLRVDGKFPVHRVPRDSLPTNHQRLPPVCKASETYP